MRTVLRGLEDHPHVQRIGLDIDYDDAWQVAFTLVQFLPVEEPVKVELLGLSRIEELMREVELILSALSG
jgi:hypothetical protein